MFTKLAVPFCTSTLIILISVTMPAGAKKYSRGYRVFFRSKQFLESLDLTKENRESLMCLLLFSTADVPSPLLRIYSGLPDKHQSWITGAGHVSPWNLFPAQLFVNVSSSINWKRLSTYIRFYFTGSPLALTKRFPCHFK